ncbi:hypothetical protein T11_2522 [Trichinella zimbabwensis]|uniref:Uncharacterized protein n=1 Tax=Trichinella zimbabwensis TaxID=268475 RepID=A0A0V1HMV4_9BILA|nr:hypothetical protein T11_2522 [Trichinella zimbabwensis]
MQIFDRGLDIKSRKNLCLLSVLNSSHSRTCLPENVCKFLFHCYVYAYVALVSVVAGLRFAVRVQWRFPCVEDHRITLKTALLFVLYTHLHLEKRDYKIYMKAVMASVFKENIFKM